MTREEKNLELQSLTEQISGLTNFYLTDSSTLNVAKINKFRALCYAKGVQFKVVKNTILKKALEANDQNFEDLYELLSGPTSLMYGSDAKSPAVILKEFRTRQRKTFIKRCFY
jgi:large subunit ribosomal protein L10